MNYETNKNMSVIWFFYLYSAEEVIIISPIVHIYYRLYEGQGSSNIQCHRMWQKVTNNFASLNLNWKKNIKNNAFISL